MSAASTHPASASRGPEWEGDWAWTPPSGARQPGEAPEVAARRELCEETGLTVELMPLAHETDEVALFVAEVSPDAEVRLDDEHDRFERLAPDDALVRCLPAIVGRAISLADASFGAAFVRPT